MEAKKFPLHAMTSIAAREKDFKLMEHVGTPKAFSLNTHTRAFVFVGLFAYLLVFCCNTFFFLCVLCVCLIALPFKSKEIGKHQGLQLRV